MLALTILKGVGIQNPLSLKIEEHQSNHLLNQ